MRYVVETGNGCRVDDCMKISGARQFCSGCRVWPVRVAAYEHGNLGLGLDVDWESWEDLGDCVDMRENMEEHWLVETFGGSQARMPDRKTVGLQILQPG